MADNHANYAKIGFTVSIGVGAIIAALVYLGGMRGKSDEFLAETYYDKTVSGLSVGSAVTFRGVKIGEVREIAFVGSKYDVHGADNSRIYILMALDDKTIDSCAGSQEKFSELVSRFVEKLGLRATVTASGITGLSTIECDFNHQENRPEIPAISWKPKYAFIPPKVSLMESFSASATRVMNQINKIDLAAVWSNVHNSVESLAQAMNSAKTILETSQGEVDRLIENLLQTSASVKDLTSELKSNPSLLIRERKPRPLEETE
ncbi:MAG: MCE family protein [Kiritimatiellae bacterium]|nr:MCE family protein [Kiritimatiellia bacterium]